MTDNMSQEMRDMLAQTERDYVGWNPDVMPQIVGEVADIIPDCDCGGFGTHYILQLDAPDGSGIAVHCFHTTLRSQIEPKIKTSRLAIGDLVAIAHRGSKESKTKGHADMNMYSVVVRQKNPPIRFTAEGDTVVS